jgi:uncharacterized protein YkwD
MRLTSPTPVLALLAVLALSACQNRVVSTATNVGLAAATVASPALAPVTAPVLAARMATPAATPASAPAQPAAPTAPPIAASTTQAGLLPLMNQFRALEGQPPMAANAALNAAALAHAFDMSQNGFIAHTGADGSTVGTRARAAGCNWTTVSENITVGQTDPAAAMFAWVNSSSHRRTILDDFTEFGEARVGDLWVAVFALGC